MRYMLAVRALQVANLLRGPAGADCMSEADADADDDTDAED